MSAMTQELLLIENFIAPAIADGMAHTPMTLPGDGRADISAYLIYHPAAVDDIVHRTSDALMEHFGITEPLYCDYATASKMTPGMSHVRHADAETPDGGPNHTAWRTVTAMLYLNTCGVDFEGGELEFPNIGEVVRPESGLLVGFRCDAIHTHEVPAVTSGTRRAIAMWFTHDPRYQDLVARRP